MKKPWTFKRDGLGPMLRMQDGEPVVEAYRNPPPRLRGNFPTMVIHCPLCGETHTHGAGDKRGAGDGSRMGHCLKSPYLGAGYWLVEVGAMVPLGRELVPIRYNHEE